MFETVQRPTPKRALVEQVYYPFEEDGGISICDRRRLEADGLETTRVVVVGGRGIRNTTDLQMLQNFAESLDAVTAGSRPLVMNGLLPVERMIGQSGKIIAPELCVVVGASGATPLLVGLRAAKKIIAVNKDADAGIFKIADIGIVADYHDVLPGLTDGLLAGR